MQKFAQWGFAHPLSNDKAKKSHFHWEEGRLGWACRKWVFLEDFITFRMHFLWFSVGSSTVSSSTQQWFCQCTDVCQIYISRYPLNHSLEVSSRINHIEDQLISLYGPHWDIHASDWAMLHFSGLLLETIHKLQFEQQLNFALVTLQIHKPWQVLSVFDCLII